MQVSCNETAIVFTDDKNKSVSLELFEAMEDAAALKAINRELSAQGSASQAAVSLMCNILNTPAMDGYKGTTTWTERISAELKQAMRRAEDEYITPLFYAQHGNPSAHAGVHESILTPEQKADRKKYAHVSEMLNKYLTAMRAGGSYAVARGFVLEYFAKAGERPIAENGKLMSVAAIKKLLDMKRKEHAAPQEHSGIAGKLVTLSSELKNRTEKTDIGNAASAIAALRSMLEFYEGVHQEALEALTNASTGPTVTQVASDAMKAAMAQHGVTEEEVKAAATFLEESPF